MQRFLDRINIQDIKKYASQIYSQRLSICNLRPFRDTKTTSTQDRLYWFFKRMEKLMDIALLLYAIGLWVGEEIRQECLSKRDKPRYSGLFVLLRMAHKFGRDVIRRVINRAFYLFMEIIYPDTRLSDVSS